MLKYQEKKNRNLERDVIEQATKSDVRSWYTEYDIIDLDDYYLSVNMFWKCLF